MSVAVTLYECTSKCDSTYPDETAAGFCKAGCHVATEGSAVPINYTNCSATSTSSVATCKQFAENYPCKCANDNIMRCEQAKKYADSGSWVDASILSTDFSCNTNPTLTECTSKCDSTYPDETAAGFCKAGCHVATEGSAVPINYTNCSATSTSSVATCKQFAENYPCKCANDNIMRCEQAKKYVKSGTWVDTSFLSTDFSCYTSTNPTTTPTPPQSLVRQVRSALASVYCVSQASADNLTVQGEYFYYKGRKTSTNVLRTLTAQQYADALILEITSIDGVRPACYVRPSFTKILQIQNIVSGKSVNQSSSANVSSNNANGVNKISTALGLGITGFNKSDCESDGAFLYDSVSKGCYPRTSGCSIFNARGIVYDKARLRCRNIAVANFINPLLFFGVIGIAFTTYIYVKKYRAT